MREAALSCVSSRSARCCSGTSRSGLERARSARAPRQRGGSVPEPHELRRGACVNHSGDRASRGAVTILKSSRQQRSIPRPAGTTGPGEALAGAQELPVVPRRRRRPGNAVWAFDHRRNSVRRVRRYARARALLLAAGVLLALQPGCVFVMDWFHPPRDPWAPGKRASVPAAIAGRQPTSSPPFPAAAQSCCGRCCVKVHVLRSAGSCVEIVVDGETSMTVPDRAPTTPVPKRPESDP